MIGCRLDRIYTSSILKSSLDFCNIMPCTFSDHDFVVLKLKLNTSITFGKTYWKLNNSILDNEQFLSSFEFYWKIISCTDTISLEWWDRMKLLIKYFCIDFSKQKNKDLFNLIKYLRLLYQSSDDLGEKYNILSQLKSL